MAKLLTIKRKDNGEIAIREHAIPGFTPDELSEMRLEALTIGLVCNIASQTEGVLASRVLLLKTYEKAEDMLNNLTRNRISDEDVDKLKGVLFGVEGD